MKQKEKEAPKERPDVSQDASGKLKVLESTLSQIDKQYGTGAVMRLGQADLAKIDAISTGSILIDQALGVGGLPVGRIIEIFGPEASGKTTIALHAIAQAQKKGGICAFIDAEHALDPSFASRIGVTINDLIVSQPDYGEQALDIAEMLVRSGAIDIIVIDSVAALVPKAELEGDMGDTHVGLQARLMSQALRKLTSVVHRSKTILIFINQVRQNINAMAYGNKEVTTGGNALKFYSSVRLDVRKIASLKRNEDHYGNKVLVKVVKNKVAPPFKKVEVDLLFSEGISQELDLLDASLQYNVVKQSGSWFSLDDENFAQGRDQALQSFRTNKQLAETVTSRIYKAIATEHQNHD